MSGDMGGYTSKELTDMALDMLHEVSARDRMACDMSKCGTVTVPVMVNEEGEVYYASKTRKIEESGLGEHQRVPWW